MSAACKLADVGWPGALLGAVVTLGVCWVLVTAIRKLTEP